MTRWGARRGRRDSCWTTRQVIARAVDRDPRTVQSSWARLARRGWIERATFHGEGRADPDDPENRTGSRIYFNWAPGRARPIRYPAEVPPPRRKPGRPRKQVAAGGEKFISPPPMIDPEAESPADLEKFISPKEEDLIAREDGVNVNVATFVGQGGDPGRPEPASGSVANAKTSDPNATADDATRPEPARQEEPRTAPDADQVEAWGLELVRGERSGNKALRNVLLWRMEDAGCLPARWVGRVPRRPSIDPGPTRRSSFEPPRAKPPSREERLRRLGGSGDLGAARALAGELAEALRDSGSVHYYAKILGEVARGDRGPASVIGALSSGIKAMSSPGVRRPGAIFAAKLNRRRSGPSPGGREGG